MILDQRRDVVGADLFRLATLHEQPDFVKAASKEALCGYDDLPPHLFADPHRQLFPIHTAPATWLSAVYFLDKKAEYEPEEADRVAGALSKAAEYWGIGPDVMACAAKSAELNRFDESSLPDSDFGVVFVNGGGVKERHMRMANGDEVKVAGMYLARHRDDFTFDDRRTIATKVLDKAAAFGVDAGPEVDRMAGLGVSPRSLVIDGLRKRAALVSRPNRDIGERLAAIADAVHAGDVDLTDASVRTKLAETIEVADRSAGLVCHYGEELDRPEDVVFWVTEKMASEALEGHVGMITGTVYDKEALAKLDLATVRAHMGNDLADALTTDGFWIDPEKMAEILPTLPRPSASLFDRMAAEVGQHPVIKRASSRQAVGMDGLAAL